MIGSEFTTKYGDSIAVLESMQVSTTYVSVDGKGNGCGLASLNPEELVRLRDMLNERIEMYRANSYLPGVTK